MTTWKRLMRSACAIGAGLSLVACANVAMLPDELDAEAKRFSPLPDKAHIYVTRTSLFAGPFVFQLYLDGKLAGFIAPNTYLLFEVDAGDHQLAVTTPESQHAVTFTVRRAQNLFLDVMPLMGWTHPRAEIVLLPEEEGRRAVVDAKRAEDLIKASPVRIDAAKPPPAAGAQQGNVRFQSQGAGADDKGVMRGWMECGNAPCPKR